jgi:signal peptide peptidase SppA
MPHPLASSLSPGVWACHPADLHAFFDGLTALPVAALPTEDLDAAPGYTVTDGVADVPVSGMLLRTAPAIFKRYGINATGYDQIVAAVAAAEADPAVKSIRLRIDSPGGTVAGVHDAADAIFAATKPVAASVDNLAASAAYWLASQADSIEVKRGAVVGSIGVFQVAVDASQAAAAEGLKFHLIASGPYKGAGAYGTELKPEHLVEMQAQVMGLAEQFRADINRGRPATDVLASADGRVYNATQALQRGLVDRITSIQTKDEPMPAKSSVEQMAALIKAHPAHAATIADLAAADHSVEQIEAAIAQADAKASADKATAAVVAAEARAVAAEKAAADAVAALEAEKAAHAATAAKADELAKLHAGAPATIAADASAGSAVVTSEQFEAMSPTERANHFAKGGRIA